MVVRGCLKGLYDINRQRVVLLANGLDKRETGDIGINDEITGDL
jgi:hypothetical protein